MKRIIIPIVVCAFYGSLFYSCNATKDPNDAILNDATKVDSLEVAKAIVLENKGLTLTEVVNSPAFLDSKLLLKSPKLDESFEQGATKFEFSVKSSDYVLGANSSDSKTKMCANSDKGQHIHVIVDNHPYEASYDTNYTLKDQLQKGNHVALAFLSRSYHESIKHKNAYALTQFTVGDEDMDKIDLNAPHLFYSRPKGEYKGADTENVMLDFYLVNTTIAKGGNYVQVTINDTVEFKIEKWAPYLIKGLPLGDNKIEIQLMDNAHKLIAGPYNAVERQFTLIKK